MPVQDRLLNFVETLRSATGIEDAHDALLAELDNYGITRAKYGFLPSFDPRHIDRDVIMVGQFHPEWDEIYNAEKLVAHDYVVEQCLLSERLVSFQEVNERLEAGEFTGKRAQIHGMSRDYDIRNGLAVPLRDEMPLSCGALSMVASNEFTESQFQRHLERFGDDLRAISEAFHTAVYRPHLLGPDCQLTERERECLLWSIHGLRAAEIADRLGTRTKTVEKQIASARRRLKARSTAQAAVKAVQLRLISP